MEKMSPFEDIYKPLGKERVNAYLDRIRYINKVEVTYNCLADLMESHLKNVPFENLDVYYARKIPSLKTDDLFEKIVINKRGGYCFELNGLFSMLLKETGFLCGSHMARIVLGREYLTPYAHRVIIVSLDGKRYFCDVGFGGPVPMQPVEITYDKVIFCKSGRRYMFEKTGSETLLKIEKDGVFVPLMIFANEICDPVDFLPLNTFCACSPDEPFLNRLMVWKGTQDGRYSIEGSILKVIVDSKPVEIELETKEDVLKALNECFNIKYEK